MNDNDRNQSQQPNSDTDRMKPFISDTEENAGGESANKEADSPQQASTDDAHSNHDSGADISGGERSGAGATGADGAGSKDAGSGSSEATDDRAETVEGSTDAAGEHGTTKAHSPVTESDGIKVFHPGQESASDGPGEETRVFAAPLRGTETDDEADADAGDGGDDPADEGKKRKERRRRSRGRIRLIPIWLRIILVLAALALALVAGAMIGYGLLGGGGDMRDVLDPDTWYYIYDLIFDGTELERER